MKFAYTIIYVNDVEKTIEFYEKAFCLKRRFIHESGGYAELETEGVTLSFASHEMIKMHLGELKVTPLISLKDPAGIEIAFVTADVTKAYQHAIEAGAISLAAPQRKPWGQEVAYVRDINGMLVELASPMP